MPSGPEHYRTAEELIAGVEQYGDDFTPEGLTAQIAIAQVHAMLALAAATALGTNGGPDEDWREWRRIAGCVKPCEPRREAAK